MIVMNQNVIQKLHFEQLLVELEQIIQNTSVPEKNDFLSSAG